MDPPLYIDDPTVLSPTPFDPTTMTYTDWASENYLDNGEVLETYMDEPMFITEDPEETIYSDPVFYDAESAREYYT